MPIHRSFPLALIACVAVASAQAAEPRKPVPPQSAESAQAQSQTLADIRNVGTAMFSWLTDQVNDDSVHGSSEPDNVSACVPADAQGAKCEVDKIPLISLQELIKILVPKYIAAIPEKDAWGHPYEFRFNWKHTLSKSVMAIRSAGSDKTFSGNSYKVGSFEPVDTDQDIVWMDGFFVRWPERGKS